MSYAGRNSPKDVAARVATVEDTRIPAIQAELDSLESQLADEVLDVPNLSLVFIAALT